MKKAKRKRPVVARKRKVTARKKPATSRKKRKSKMSKKSNDDEEDDSRTESKRKAEQSSHVEPGPQRAGTRQSGTASDQMADNHPRTTQVGNDLEVEGDPMGQPPDSPLNPNMPPDPSDPLQRTRPADHPEQQAQAQHDRNRSDK